MTSIDELFKSSSGSIKRKFENPIEADPSQAYKSAKLDSGSDAKRAAQVDDDEDDEAGPSLPPDFEEEPGDDEEDKGGEVRRRMAAEAVAQL
jgi:beta-catenin-like protein 1